MLFNLTILSDDEKEKLPLCLCGGSFDSWEDMEKLVAQGYMTAIDQLSIRGLKS